MNFPCWIPRSLWLIFSMLVVGYFSGPGVSLHAEAPPMPAWWTERGVMKPGSPTADDYAAVNQGQARNMAKQAYEEFKVSLPGGAGAALDDIWAIPASSSDDYRAINIGQIKNLVSLFYERLHQIDPNIRAPWTGVGADDYALANIGQVKNVFNFDPSLVAASVVTASDPAAPQVELVASILYTVEDHATLSVHMVPSEGAVVEGIALNGLSVTPLVNDFSRDVALVSGINVFTLVATDDAGRSRSVSVTITRDVGTPRIVINSPVAGVVIDANSINVSGLVGDASLLKSVVVNGVRAYVHAGAFEAPAVSLVNGANVIVVTVTDVLGNTSTASVSVTAQVPVISPGSTLALDPVVLTATPIQGSAPLAVNFNVQVNAPGIVQRIVYDFDGLRKNLITATTPSSVSHTYTVAGNYYPAVTVYTNKGAFTSKGGYAVPVSNRLKIKVSGGVDSPLVAWSDFNKFIKAQDVEGALECVGISRRVDCRTALNDLGPDESVEMITDLKNLTEITTTSEISQYMADVTTPQGVISFPIFFFKEDGQWRVDSF